MTTNSEKRIPAPEKILPVGFCSWSLVIRLFVYTIFAHSSFSSIFVGILTGLVACTVDIVIEKISALKHGFLKTCKQLCQRIVLKL